MSENKNRMTTTELVDIVTSFCEMYSGINFYPYQEQFARRIIRSVLTNDGNEISALFSRQCIPEGELIHTREGGLVKIEDHPDSWVTNESAEVLQISIKGGYTLKCTANHPVMTDKGWLQAGLLKAGDKVEVLLKWDKFEESFKPKIVDHTNIKFYTDYYLNTQMKKGTFSDYTIPVSSIGEDGEELGLSNVESIKKLEGTYRVYDVTYPDKGWFICNGVKVHNSGKSETVSVVSGGMMVILPKLANTPMFAEDPRLQMFRNGLMVGIFAPSQRQAQTTYGKIRSKVESDRGLEILSDPEFNLRFTTSNGTTVALSNGSFVTAISASDGSNIEGESFHVIICEECLPKGSKITTSKGLVNIEDVKVGDLVTSFNHETNSVEEKVVERSFSQPLYGRKMVNLHLDNGKVLRCTDNHKVFIKNKNYIRSDTVKVGDSMLYYSHTTQESEIVNAKKSNDIRDSSRGWLHKLPYKRVKKSTLYNKSVNPPERICVSEISTHRTVLHKSTERSTKLRERLVTLPSNYPMLARTKELPRSVLPKQREETSNPRVVRLTRSRRSSLLVLRRWFSKWESKKYGNTYPRFFSIRKRAFSSLAKREVQHTSFDRLRQENKQTLSSFPCFGKKQVPLFNTSVCPQEYDVQNFYNRCRKTLQDMWGNVFSVSKRQFNMSKEYVPGNREEELRQGSVREAKVIKVEIEEEQDITVYDLTVADNHNFFAESVLVHNCQDISDFKLKKSIHPMGAAYNASIIKIGTASTRKGDFYNVIQRNKKEFEDGVIRIRNHFEYDYKVVSKYNEKYRKYIEQEKRRLGEKSDEFLLSYALTWILQRGMFIDIDEFEARNVDPNYDLVPYDKSATHVVGIDVGGASDSTVITVCEVDWTMPVVMESRTDEETGEEIVYQCYNTYVKAWHEIKDTPNFEEQYVEIMHFLSNFKIARLIIDATKESALADRINANTSYEVISYVFSSKSKSDLYKTFEREVNSGRVHVPGGEETKQSPEYLKCLAQLQDLEKSWRGAYMVVSHPPTKDGRDDFPDSLALAIWGCMDRGEVSDIRGSDRRAFINPNAKLFKERNQYTARRRR